MFRGGNGFVKIVFTYVNSKQSNYEPMSILFGGSFLH